MIRWSNCLIEARLEYWRRVRAWRKNPSLPMPYYIKRPSYASPWISHRLVGRFDGGIEAIRPSSFQPEAPKPRLRWWQLPIAFLFRGRWVSGDTRPGELGER